MIKRNLRIIIPLLTCTALVAQVNTDVYRVIYLKPKSGVMDELLTGMKEHNKKHHNKGIMKVRTYRVVSGEKAGWLVRTYGPMTWSQVDKFTDDANSKAHRADGTKKITPYVEKRIGPSYWSPQEDLSHNRSSSSKPSKMTKVTYSHINNGTGGDFRELQRQFKEVHEKTNSKASYTMGRLVHGGELNTFATFRGMDSWADMASTGPSWSSRYNEVHGNDAWGRWLKRVQKVTKKRHDEMRVYLEDQSTR